MINRDNLLLIHNGIYARGAIPQYYYDTSTNIRYRVERLDVSRDPLDPLAWNVVKASSSLGAFQLLAKLEIGTVRKFDSLKNEQQEVVSFILDVQ